MDKITLDAFMTQLGEDECESGLWGVADAVAKTVKQDYGLTVDDAEFVLKDAVPDVTEKGAGDERTIKSYITTIAQDRDNEAVMPEGAIMDDYNMLKIVLYGHQYDKMGVGKNLWIIRNDRHSIDGMYGLIALTKYATIKANPFADQVYNWRMEDMPMAESIGFIPVEWFAPDDKEWSKLFDGWVKRVTSFMQSKSREVTDDLFDGLKRIYTKWIMLEYSDVMMPSNAHAVTLAISKGLLSEADIDRYTIKTPIVPEGKVDVITEEVDDWNPDDDAEVKEGRRFSAKTLAVMRIAHEALGSLLEAPAIEEDVDIEGIEFKDDEQITLPDMTQEEMEKFVAAALAEPIDDELEIEEPSPQDKARLMRGETL